MKVSMNMEKPLIKVFQIPGGKYFIYDTNTNKLIETSKTVAEAIKKLGDKDEPDIDGESLKAIEAMKKSGYLSANRVKKITHPCDDNLEYMLQNKMKAIAIQVTQQCNLRCDYCPYSGKYSNRSHNNKKMSIETAKKGIDLLINSSIDLNKINVGFYGGEPLLEFDFIKECMIYAEKQACGKQLSFSITTNATLLNKKMTDFLIKNDVNLLISLDGPQHFHDSNRRFAGTNAGTFDKTMESIDSLKKLHPSYSREKVLFSIVLDPERSFSCVNTFFTDYDTVKGIGTMASVITQKYANFDVKYNEDFIAERNYEIFKVMLCKINKLDSCHVSSVVGNSVEAIKQMCHDTRSYSKMLAEEMHHSGPCIPGAQRLFIDVNGFFYPCEKISETSETMRIGHIDSGFDIEKCRKILNIGRLTEDECKNCWAIRMCNQCAIAADKQDYFCREKKLSECKYTKIAIEESLKDYCTMRELGYDFQG